VVDDYHLLYYVIISLAGNFGPTSLVQALNTTELLESDNCQIECSLAALQFPDICFSEYLSSCN